MSALMRRRTAITTLDGGLEFRYSLPRDLLTTGEPQAFGYHAVYRRSPILCSPFETSGTSPLGSVTTCNGEVVGSSPTVCRARWA
jgi:hypothetical protein